MTEQRRQMERDWIKAADDRDRLRAESREARRSGNPEAVSLVKAQLREATERCRAVMADYQTIVALEGQGIVKPPVKGKTGRGKLLVDVVPEPAFNPAQMAALAKDIADALDALIVRAEAAGLVKVVSALAVARDEAAKTAR